MPNTIKPVCGVSSRPASRYSPRTSHSSRGSVITVWIAMARLINWNRFSPLFPLSGTGPAPRRRGNDGNDESAAEMTVLENKHGLR